MATGIKASLSTGKPTSIQCSQEGLRFNKKQLEHMVTDMWVVRISGGWELSNQTGAIAQS